MKFITVVITLLIISLLSPCVAAREKSDMSADFGFTRDRKFTIWPLFIYHREKKGDKFKFDMLFSMYRYNRGFNQRFTHSHLFPLYFKNKNENITDLRLFSAYYPSLFHYYKNREKKLGSFKFMEFHPKVSLLDFTRSENGLFVKNNFLFLLWHENDQKRKTQHLVFFPFYWHYKNPKYSSHTFFPFFSTGKSPDETVNHLNITPLFSHRESESDKKTRLYPIWWKGEEIKRGDTIRYNHIMPFYWSRSGRGKRSNIFFPFFWKFEDKKYRSITFFPFVSRGKSEDGYRSHLAITPLYKRSRRKKRKSQRLFPIWWQGSYDEGGPRAYRYNHIAPIYWSVKSKTKEKHVFFPLIWSLKDKYYESFTFFPLFSKGVSTSGKRKHIAITPLFHYRQYPREKTWRFYPFWWRMTYESKKGYKESYNHIAPLFWSYKHGENRAGFSIFPLIWSKRTKDRKSFRIFPIIHRSSRTYENKESFSLFPLFFHKRSTYHKKNTLFPIWFSGTQYYKKDTTLLRKYNHIVPIYWSSETKTRKGRVLFPFVWKFEKPSYESFSLFPFFSRGKSPDTKRSHLMITPLFYQRNNPRGFNRMLFPLWWQGEYNGDKGYFRKYNHIAPFFWSTQKRDSRNWAFAPFVWSLHDSYRDVISFAPLFRYWKRKRGDHSLLSITPLYHHRVKNGLHSNRLYPIWFQGTKVYKRRPLVPVNHKVIYTLDTVRYNHIAPLYWSRKGSNHHSRVLFPLYWDRMTPNYKSLSLFPLFSFGSSPNKNAGHLSITPLFRHKYFGGLSRSYFFPFWFHGRKVDEINVWDRTSKEFDRHKDTVTYNHIMPLYFSKRGSYNNNKVLFPLYWSFNNPYYQSKTLFPLFSFGSSPDKNGTHLSITPLFHHKKGLNSSGLKKKSTILFPFYWNFERGNRSSRVFFPLLWELDKDKGADSAYSATTVPGLFSRGKSKDGITSNLMLGSLFWHRKNALRQRTAFYPFFHYRNTFHVEQKFDLMFFLYRYKKAKTRTSHSVLWPLVASTRDIDYHTFRVSPLFWYKRDLNSTFFLTPPLFFYKDDEYKKKFRFLWQLYAFNSVKGEKKQHSILWKLWDLNKYDNGDREFRILHYLYTNKRVKGSVERGVFPFFRFKKDAEGNRSLGFFFNMFKTTKKKLQSCDDYYREQRIFWFIRIRSNYGTLSEECRKDVFKK